MLSICQSRRSLQSVFFLHVRITSVPTPLTHACFQVTEGRIQSYAVCARERETEIEVDVKSLIIGTSINLVTSVRFVKGEN